MFEVIGRTDGIVRTVYAFYRSEHHHPGSVWFLIFADNDWRRVDPSDYVPYIELERS